MSTEGSCLSKVKCYLGDMESLKCVISCASDVFAETTNRHASLRMRKEKWTFIYVNVKKKINVKMLFKIQTKKQQMKGRSSANF